ncbi:MAG: hypothetical protein HPY60_01145 [Candidatus Methanofastidiosum sp.]|nr:hypothetical protein [Methanofastidiosum sp.]
MKLYIAIYNGDVFKNQNVDYEVFPEKEIEELEKIYDSIYDYFDNHSTVAYIPALEENIKKLEEIVEALKFINSIEK